jgi:hypothetical protein
MTIAASDFVRGDEDRMTSANVKVFGHGAMSDVSP